MGFVCLAYHRIADDARAVDPLAVSPARLRAQLAWLARHGYAGVPLSEAPAAAGRGRRVVALTFDDGTADFCTEAWPVLQAAGFGATLFVVAGRVGRRADWPGAPDVRLLDWPALRALSAAGVEIGAHGLTHAPLDALPLAQVRAELAEARDRLAQRLGCAPAGLAYPYGRFTPAIAEAAREAGFAWACTTRGGRNTPRTPRWQLRRALLRGVLSRLCFAAVARTGYARLVEAAMDVRRLP